MFAQPSKQSSSLAGVAPASALERALIEDTSGDGEILWRQVDAALQAGHEVWLRSPLLASLQETLGREREGARWLVLKPRQDSAWRGWIARLRDATFSVFAMIALLPFIGAVASAVKLSSPGPLFYSNYVVGKDRRIFRWRKFRSMRVVPESEDAKRRVLYQAFVEQSGTGTDGSTSTGAKVIDRSRVTSVGRWIRRYSVDELPQLWNVLRGQMSLVGPRPCLPYEADFYSGWRGRRFTVKPGLTGLWQVFGRGRVGFDEAAAMDVYYAYSQSTGFDLYLIFRTILVVFAALGDL